MTASRETAFFRFVNNTCKSTFGQVASRREEVNLIAAIERKRRTE